MQTTPWSVAAGDRFIIGINEPISYKGRLDINP